MDNEGLALRITAGYYGPYAVNVNVCRTTGDGLPHGLGYEHALDDLAIKWYGHDIDQWNPVRTFTSVQQSKVVYRSVFEVNLSRAEQMAAVLRRVQRGLAKIAGVDGPPLSHGQYVLRVARVLGIKHALVQSRGDWAEMPVVEAANCLTHLMADWIEAGRQHVDSVA